MRQWRNNWKWPYYLRHLNSILNCLALLFAMFTVWQDSLAFVWRWIIINVYGASSIDKESCPDCPDKLWSTSIIFFYFDRNFDSIHFFLFFPDSPKRSSTENCRWIKVDVIVYVCYHVAIHTLQHLVWLETNKSCYTTGVDCPE